LAERANLEQQFTHYFREAPVRTVLILFACLVASIAMGAITGYIAAVVLPCEWFGSNFEGACGYGVLWTAVGIGALTAAVAFGSFSFRTVSAAFSGVPAASRSERQLMVSWAATVVVLLAMPFMLPYAGFGDMIDYPAYLLCLGLFIAVSLVLVRKLRMSSFWVLLPLVPFVGTFALAVLIIRAYVTRPKAVA
jgi:hypothetical protein